jgi:hypothetical protein
MNNKCISGCDVTYLLKLGRGILFFFLFGANLLFKIKLKAIIYDHQKKTGVLNESTIFDITYW